MTWAFFLGRFIGVDNMGIVDNGFLIDALRCYCGHCGQVKFNSPHYPQKGKGKKPATKGHGQTWTTWAIWTSTFQELQ